MDGATIGTFGEPGENLAKRRLAALLLATAGTIGAAAGVALFLLLQRTEPNDLFLAMIRGGFIGGMIGSLIPLFAKAAALGLGSVRNVRLEEDCLVVESARSARTLAYEDINPVGSAAATIDQSLPRLGLILKSGKGGKPLHVPRTLDRFDELAAALGGKVGTSFLAAMHAPEPRKRKVYRWLNVSGILFMSLVLAVAILYLGANWLAAFRLEREGRNVRGRIVQHYVYNNRAHRIRYLFIPPGGMPVQRDLILPEQQWRGYKDGDGVDVRYLPHVPEFNRLADEEKDGSLLWLMLLGAAEICFALAGGLLTALGRKFEFVGGRLRLAKW